MAYSKPITSVARSTLSAALMMGGALAAFSGTATAQDEDDVIVVQGIRAALEGAIDEKRASANLKEVILAEDIGKLPDQNLAEVLENITGVQITRTAGVGSGVQIRGVNENRVEINGVSTVPSGASRTGINFEDLNAAIIAGVEVIKAPEAKTIEGSVGGTINLRTIRPLDLDKMLLAARIQGEDSSLSTEDIQPRLSGAFGNRWETGAGEFGFVISGSYTEQESVSFRPRTDRDNVASFPDETPSEFLGIQFLVQEQENFDYETTNIATTLEWAPNDEFEFSLDYIATEQERSQDSYRLQASGVSTLRQISYPTSFETVDFGVGPGRFPAALTGFLEPDLDNDDDDPNLRFSSDTGARVTDTEIFTLAGNWERGNWRARAEFATSKSDTTNPNLSTTLNFINPNCPLDGTSNDNCVPFVYDLSGNTLSWGINFASDFAPDPADLLNPANVVLDQVQVAANTTENQEDAFRLDASYDLTDSGLFSGVITSVDVGFRYNESSSTFDRIADNIGGFSQMVDSPNGLLFQELLVAGPSNFNDGDGRSLFISDFLLVDPDRAFSDPQGVIDILQAAVIAHDPDSPDILNLQSDQDSFYDIVEETKALYAQANFDWSIFTGNLGVRYLETEVSATSFGIAAEGEARSLETNVGEYDFVLPRFNLVAQPSDNVLVRLGYGSDIRRPDFNDLAGFNFDTSENSAVNLGNPELRPEQVDSFDVAVEWYFAPASLVSVGYFRKERTDIISSAFEGALLLESTETTGGFARETDPSCPGGGIFNPAVVPNVLGDPTMLGLCVDFNQPVNDSDTTTQTGFEFAFQYDLSQHEDRLGWASGFGVLANYTIQDFSGGSAIDTTSGRGLTVLGDVSIPRGLLDFSENAYNITGYFEKYGISARARYTWREGFRTQDFGGGANTSGSSTFSFPVHTLDRGQLNASINYDVTDQLNIGVEAVNLTEEKIFQHCVSETGPLCFVGIPDRRITFGASYRF